MSILYKRIPDFQLAATGDKDFSPEFMAGTAWVLYFYPKDNTAGCTTEALNFQNAKAAFESVATKIVGVSRESLRSHQNFQTKHGFDFDLISDPEEQLCKAFDVIREKSLYGRKYIGIERSTFLIDRDGILQHEWRKVRVKGHVEQVLAAATQLQATQE